MSGSVDVQVQQWQFTHSAVKNLLKDAVNVFSDAVLAAAANETESTIAELQGAGAALRYATWRVDQLPPVPDPIIGVTLAAAMKHLRRAGEIAASDEINGEQLSEEFAAGAIHWRDAAEMTWRALGEPPIPA